MRILEVNKFYYLRRGAERHLLDLLALVRKRGHTAEVFAMRHPENLPARFESFFPSFVGYNDSDAALWQKIKGAGRLFWSFEARRKMRALLAKWQPDVAHLHNIYHQLSPSLLGPIQELGIPIVMTVHDYHLISPDKDAYSASVGSAYWKFLFIKKYGFGKRLLLVLKMYWEQYRRSYEAVDRYIVPSTYCKKILVQGGMLAEKITVLPHFILNTVQHSSDSDAAGDAKRPYALYFGSLSDEKGVNGLADLFGTLGIPLVLCGTVADGFVLRSNPFVTLLGQQSEEALAGLIRGAQCVVSASALPETFGLIALEAIAFGKPFFGLKTGAYPEIIEDGRNGFLFDDIRSLGEYLTDFFSGKHAFISRQIREDAEQRFGEEAYAKKIEELFTRLIEEKKEKKKQA